MVFGESASSFSDLTILKGLMSFAWMALISTKVAPSPSEEVPNLCSVLCLSVVVDVTAFQQTCKTQASGITIPKWIQMSGAKIAHQAALLI
jgi:hypothetical protein